MNVVKYKPTSPGRRNANRLVNKFLYKGSPYKGLIFRGIKRTGGRNNDGRITTRHIGGGHKKKYRLIDFKRNKDNIVARVERIEYDPNRSSFILLLVYRDGERRYILYPKGIKVGDKIESGLDIPIKVGNSLPIMNIPIGTLVHNIEMKPGKGGQIARSAGTYAQVISREGNYVFIRMRSGEIRKIFLKCRATIGEVGNEKHMLRIFGKAGVKRWLGIRPTVRGTAMNPVDHPHGGGEGKNFGKHPVTPWGISTKGKKTRKNKRTDKYIVQFRKRK